MRSTDPSSYVLFVLDAANLDLASLKAGKAPIRAKREEQVSGYNSFIMFLSQITLINDERHPIL